MKRTIFPILPTTFVAVVERGSITGAAEALGLAKSAVSQNLKRLEAQVGVKLAVRTTRRFHLTSAGEHYFRQCKQIVTLAKRADAEMELFGAQPAGKMRVTAPHAMIASVIAPALAELVSLYPNVKPELLAEDKRLDIVDEGIDVAITLGDLKDSNLKARRVGTMEDVLCAAGKMVDDGHQSTIDAQISSIEKLPYIAHEREHRTDVYFELTHLGSSETRDVLLKRTYTANTVNALLALCHEGLGIAMLPNFAISDELRTGALVQLFPSYTLGKTPIYAVHPYDNYVPASVTAFIEAVKIRLAE